MLFLLFGNLYAQERELVAVLTLKNVSERLWIDAANSYNDILCGHITTDLMKTRKFRLVERSRVTEVLREQRFQVSSDLTISQIQSIGRILGVRKVITGEYKMNSSVYHSANIRMIDVQSGIIDASASANFSSAYNADAVIQSLATELVNQIMEYY
jgi:TolB-like protein